jgi:hypothetical protein
MNRRLFLQSLGIAAGGSVLGLAALNGMAGATKKLAAVHPLVKYTLGFTDGWVSMPAQAAPIPPFFPDPSAPTGLTTYVMGIRDLTYLNGDPDKILAEKGKAAISGPLMWAHVDDHVMIDLWNLGLAARPDLTDSHTVTGTASPTRSPTSTGCLTHLCRHRSVKSSATSTTRRTQAPTCTTATSRTWSTCTWA